MVTHRMHVRDGCAGCPRKVLTRAHSLSGDRIVGKKGNKVCSPVLYENIVTSTCTVEVVLSAHVLP